MLLADAARTWSRLWIDPHTGSRRSWPEVRTLAGAFARRLARGGVRDTLRWARQTERRATDAERYLAWCVANTPDRAALDEMARRVTTLSARPRFSILVPSYNTPPDLLEACLESVRAQVYPDWELIIADDGSSREETRACLRRYEGEARIQIVWNAENQGIAANTQSALARATGDFVGLLDADDELLPHALFRVAEVIAAQPSVDVVYSDEDKLELDGSRSDAYFKPDWSPDLFLSSMYVCHFLVLRRSVVDAAGGLRSAFDGSQDYDLMLRVMDRTDRIAHVPDVLYHWRKTAGSTSSVGAAKPWAFDAGRRALQDFADRNRLDATVEDTPAPGLYRMRYHLRATPRVSVILPSYNSAVGNRESAVPHVERASSGLPTADARLAQVHRFLAALKRMRYPDVEIVHAAGSAGAMLNAAARGADGRMLLFVEPWLEPMDDDWMTALVEHAQRPDVGIVGGKTFYPDGRLRHMGLIVGADGLVGRPFDGYAGTWAGYFANADAIRNCRAVGRAGLMTPKALFDELGGFDDALRSAALELDYALRVAARGLRVVFTPYARAIEHVGAEQNERVSGAEAERLKARWGTALQADPYYNPHFVGEDPNYRVRI